jgi:hypothetical protein
MSALPVVIPEISATRTPRSPRTAAGSTDVRPSSVSTPISTHGSWKLTDRGITAVMVLAAVILTVALAVIGITAVRVTGADYDAGSQESQQAHH